MYGASIGSHIIPAEPWPYVPQYKYGGGEELGVIRVSFPPSVYKFICGVVLT